MLYSILKYLYSGMLAKRLACIVALAVVFSVPGGVISGPASDEARADVVIFGGPGFGFAFGSRGYRGGFYGPPYRPYGPPYYYHPYDMRAYPYRSRVYVNPPRYRAPRGAVPYTKTGIPPFTRKWVAYCSRKFKSFNPRTGTYLAYSGRYRYCR